MSLTGKKCDNDDPHLQHEWRIQWQAHSPYWCAGTRIREVCDREQPFEEATPGDRRDSL